MNQPPILTDLDGQPPERHPDTIFFRLSLATLALNLLSLGASFLLAIFPALDAFLLGCFPFLESIHPGVFTLFLLIGLTVFGITGGLMGFLHSYRKRCLVVALANLAPGAGLVLLLFLSFWI